MVGGVGDASMVNGADSACLTYVLAKYARATYVPAAKWANVVLPSTTPSVKTYFEYFVSGEPAGAIEIQSWGSPDMPVKVPAMATPAAEEHRSVHTHRSPSAS